MSSGIYKLTFRDGSVYIGKSTNTDKRWGQHSKAMLKGTHTKKIQEAFEKFGDPKYEVIFKCHPDHLDILEGYFINVYWSDTILNTTQPPDLTPLEKAELKKVFNAKVWDMSTFEHLRYWSNTQTELDQTKSKITNIRNGKYVKELEEEIDELIEDYKDLAKKNKALKDRGLISRIFNLDN